MVRFVFAGVLWLISLGTALSAYASLRADRAFATEGIERHARVKAHLLGPAIATRPGRTYTSLLLEFETDGGEPEQAILHGEVSPPPVGRVIPIRHLPGRPAEVRRACAGLARFRDGFEGSAFALLVVALALAATLGCGARATPALRHAPGLVVALGIVGLGIVLGLSLLQEAVLVRERHRATRGVIVRVDRCTNFGVYRRSRYGVPWCTELRYVLDGRQHTTRGPTSFEAPRVGTVLQIRVHPDYPDLVTVVGNEGIGLLVFSVMLLLSVGGLSTAALFGSWRDARREEGSNPPEARVAESQHPAAGDRA